MPRTKEKEMTRDQLNKLKKDALEKIAKDHGVAGEPRAKWVVEAARDPDHILHQFFDWDLEEAAQRDLLRQARSMISTVYCIISNTKIEFNVDRYKLLTSKEVPFYVERGSEGYVSVSKLAQDPEHSKEVLRIKLKTIRTLTEGVRELAERLDQEAEVENNVAFVEEILEEILAAPETA